jgi:hypothetical protein
MRFEYFRKFLSGNPSPLHGFHFRAQQSGPVIMPVNLLDRLTAIRARSAAVPLLRNTPHRATFRIVFNLAETFLLAVTGLWPAGTLVETDSCVFALQNIDRSFTAIHVHGRRVSRFWTSHEPLAPVLQVCAGRHNEANGCAGN